MKILGIETSCDETAVAIVDDQKQILSHIVNSQIDLHQEFGGVVPELAARSHSEIIDKIVVKALKDANLNFNDIDAFAATSGPGLIGGVIVGMMMAKTLAAIHNKPFLAINHLEAHALTARLVSDIKFPYLLLLVSGGHCQVLLCNGLSKYKKLGETIDDAIGEAFDKVAQMLDLKYPGGPEIERLAKLGDENFYKLPKPLIDNKNHDNLYNFSLSGLKTAIRRLIERLAGENFNHFTSPQKISYQEKCNIAASFQKTIADIIVNRLNNIVNDFDLATIKNLVVAGGVAANQYILHKLKNWSEKYNIEVQAPPIKLCTDNAAMIAWVGVEKLKQQISDQNHDKFCGDNLNFTPKARWELEELKNIKL